MTYLSTISEALNDFRDGKFLIVVDDEDRENEGDFITAAEMITAEKVNSCCAKGVECSVRPSPSAVPRNWSYPTK